MTETEAILLERARAGDKDAFEQFYRNYANVVMSVIRNILRIIPDHAEDVARDVFVKAFEKLQQFRGDAKFSTWLHRMAVNAAIDELRRVRPHYREQFDDNVAVADALQHNISAGTDLDSTYQIKEDVRIRAEECCEIAERVLRTMEPNHVRIVRLNVYDGLDVGEIMAETGLTYGKVQYILKKFSEKVSKVRQALDLAQVRWKNAKKNKS